MATATEVEVTGPVRLSFARGRVCIPAGDAERYLRVVESARPTDEPGRPSAQFETLFLRPVRAWCESRRDKVWACYAPPPGDMPTFYIFTHVDRYDEPLHRELHALQLSCFNAGWRLYGRIIPTERESVDFTNWFDIEVAIEIYADGEPAREEDSSEPSVFADD